MTISEFMAGIASESGASAVLRELADAIDKEQFLVYSVESTAPNTTGYPCGILTIKYTTIKKDK